MPNVKQSLQSIKSKADSLMTLQQNGIVRDKNFNITGTTWSIHEQKVMFNLVSDLRSEVEDLQHKINPLF